MKALVCAKRVVDPNVKVRVKSDFSNVEIEHSKMSLNPFDENAIEEAVRLKERGIVTEIVAVSIGSAKCEETLRNALARGCDRAILVESSENYEPINIANILQKIVATEQPQLIMLGKQAIDDDANQVAQMLAGKLGIAQATFVSQLEVNADSLVARREIDGGTQKLELKLPAVVSADLYLNEPRFIKLPQLMQAKKKPIEKVAVTELGLELNARTRLVKVMDGEVKKQCKFVDSSNQLVELIKKGAM
ncbi:MAG: electron transfer flavoprotein subunit beta/FixA family protein [Neisseriaceae bacterium]|nr:MAG: electron transfer flavoprotein subunit beta/FixA family protein [Neisseriaceae bacterium]